MKLWQGWHNTDLGRSYFHYGPFGGTKKQMGIVAQTCKKRGVKSTGKKREMEKSQVGGFLSNSRKICIQKNFCQISGHTCTQSFYK